MRTKHARSITTGLIALTALIGSGIGSASASDGAHHRRNIPVNAHYEAPPDVFTVAPPCTIDQYIPVTGLCHGVDSGHATVTGSWIGVDEYDAAFVVTPANITTITGLNTFTGTITGCGTGTITYQFDGTIDAAGNINTSWHAIAELGSGDLANVTGHGTEHAAYNADFSQSGDVTGVLRCNQPHNRN